MKNWSCEYESFKFGGYAKKELKKVDIQGKLKIEELQKKTKDIKKDIISDEVNENS